MEDPGLLSAFLDNLVSRLFSLAEEKYKLYKGFEGDLAFLKSELKMITSAIDGQLLGQDDHILRLSIEELRQLAHEMEDCIDHIVYDASWEQQQPWYCKMVNTGKKRITFTVRRRDAATKVQIGGSTPTATEVFSVPSIHIPAGRIILESAYPSG